ncbi:esterase family protein [bacterium]|nr:esterase family protein [bacterium]
MALLHCNFFSDTLGLSCSMNVLLPQKTTREALPVLYLLHGRSDDYTGWLRRTSIERYVDGLDLAVVMPDVHRSYYTDMAHGGRYWTFIAEELPAICRGFFPLSAEREDTFVAGLSMGGYGAFKLALSHPERFAAAASLSGALDPARVTGSRGDMRREWELIYGDLDAHAGSDNDVMYLAERVAASDGPKPRLFQWCGTDDFLYKGNIRFRDHARALGLDLDYSEGPGAHAWECWDAQIQNVIEWMGV